jgi:hypothetical protein
MNKSFTLFSFLIFILLIGSASAQDALKNAEANDTKRDTKTFKIVSVDGKNRKVTIIPDYLHHVLKIGCLTDTINIDNFWGVPPEVHLLNKSFIEIKYEVRGGSNLGLGNTLILCVNDNVLIETMHILRYTSWGSGDLKTDYHIKLTLNENGKNDYMLNADIYDKVYSKNNSEENYVYNNRSVLNFDKKQHVFYSIKKNIYNNAITTAAGKKKKQKYRGNFPVIILGKESYYFISGRWYQTEDSNELHEFK